MKVSKTSGLPLFPINIEIQCENAKDLHDLLYWFESREALAELREEK